MPRFEPVDHDPFAPRPMALMPVDNDPFMSPEDDFAYGKGIPADATWRNLIPAAELGLSLAPGSGEAMSAREAWNASGRGAEALSEGNYGDAASEYLNMGTGLLGAIPGAGIVARGTKRGAAWMDRNLPEGFNRLIDAVYPQGYVPKDTAYAIPAWHGSPHDFDEFKLDKIGSGEGAQAYGHGLYFAENPSVATAYQKGLSPIIVGGKEINEASPVGQYLRMKTLGELDSRIARQEETIAELEKTRLRSDIVENPNTAKMVDDMLTNHRANLAIMKEADVMDIQSQGRLYRTEIDVEPEDLLDWDLPLSQQGEKVQANIKKMVDETLTPGAWEKVKDRRAGEFYDTVLSGGHNAGRAESTDRLKKYGIPGIRYLDQGSRGAGVGTSNYVIFDDSLVKVLGKE